MLAELCYCALLALVVPIMSTRIPTVTEYFPEIKRDLALVTWAHGVNSQDLLSRALEDSDVMMLEADILMGTVEGVPDDEPVPIMAHPPATTSDLKFTDFLEAVISATSQDDKKKGIKLDFKDIDAVEPCLQLINASLLTEPNFPLFPIFVNADILAGPIQATKKPLDPARFISLAKEYTPSATLSVGWTTRYGLDDSSTGELLEIAKYTRQNVRDMAKMIRKYAGDPAIFPHVTFPVRAAIAQNSVEELYILKSSVNSIHTETSFTLWSPATDKVDFAQLQSFVQQFTTYHCFVDLPFSLNEDMAIVHGKVSAASSLRTGGSHSHGGGHGQSHHPAHHNSKSPAHSDSHHPAPAHANSNPSHSDEHHSAPSHASSSPSHSDEHHSAPSHANSNPSHSDEHHSEHSQGNSKPSQSQENHPPPDHTDSKRSQAENPSIFRTTPRRGGCKESSSHSCGHNHTSGAESVGTSSSLTFPLVLPVFIGAVIISVFPAFHFTSPRQS